MKNRSQTIRKIVGYLNNSDEDGGFWLPNIQRPFVWTEEQICRLFDSILREYPISTLLIWKTKSVIRRRSFIANWKESIRQHLSDYYRPENDEKKCLVLDGQQRLQALYIGLKGSYEGKELCINILSGEISEPDDVKYTFSFLDSKNIKFPWCKFKAIVFSEKRPREIRSDIEESAGRELTETEIDKITDHVELIAKTFTSDETITYQELDSIDNHKLYSDDDVVEVFIRANSGGTKLSRSDLLFSLLNSSWEMADDKMETLLDSLNRHGFNFDRDFVLKTCLVLLDQYARYEVKKFRKPGVREDIESNWDKIATSIQDILDWVRGKTYIQCDKAMPSYLALMPLVYLRYHFPEKWDQAKDVDQYLIRTSLTGSFGGQPDTMIDALVRKFVDTQQFDLNEVYSIVRSVGRSLELTEDKFWQMGYGSKTVHLLFNIWYRDFNHTPAYVNNMPQVDHVFPQSMLRKVKDENPDTNRQDLMRYPKEIRNQLANCMLLSREENGAGGKSDTPPAEWFPKRVKEEGDAYLEKHLIPKDPALWELDRFEDFIEARKELIREKLGYLIVSSTN